MEASIFASQLRSFSSWRGLFDPEPISWLAYSIILTALLVEVTHICAPVDILKAFPISQPFVMSERSPSILLVEDEPFVQTLLAAYLEKERVVVTVASTAAEMRAVLRSPGQPIDAIALDLGLPDEEGLALVRQLRMRLDVPICITTRDDSEASRTVAAELGVDDYLIKRRLCLLEGHGAPHTGLYADRGATLHAQREDDPFSGRERQMIRDTRQIVAVFVRRSEIAMQRQIRQQSRQRKGEDGQAASESGAVCQKGHRQEAAQNPRA